MSGTVKFVGSDLTSSKTSVASGGRAPSLYDSGSNCGTSAVALSCRKAISPVKEINATANVLFITTLETHRYIAKINTLINNLINKK